MLINTTFSIFQDGGLPPSWICESSKFQLLVCFGGPICVIMPNAVPIGQTLPIYHNFNFVGCRPPPSWISLNFKSVTDRTVTRAELRHPGKFR